MVDRFDSTAVGIEFLRSASATADANRDADLACQPLIKASTRPFTKPLASLRSGARTLQAPGACGTRLRPGNPHSPTCICDQDTSVESQAGQSAATYVLISSESGPAQPRSQPAVPSPERPETHAGPQHLRTRRASRPTLPGAAQLQPGPRHRVRSMLVSGHATLLPR